MSDVILDEMVRDFTAVSYPMAKSEVRNRIVRYVDIKLAEQKEQIKATLSARFKKD